MGVTVRVRLKADASAALSNAKKLGPGRMKHVMLNAMYIKEAIKARLLSVEKIASGNNVSDIMTKPLQGDFYQAS